MKEYKLGNVAKLIVMIERYGFEAKEAYASTSGKIPKKRWIEYQERVIIDYFYQMQNNLLSISFIGEKGTYNFDINDSEETLKFIKYLMKKIWQSRINGQKKK